MVGETLNSILVKEGRVEITFLFHSKIMYQLIMIPYTLNIYDFLFVLRFLSWKNSDST